jgi:hypothetical protein
MKRHSGETVGVQRQALVIAAGRPGTVTLTAEGKGLASASIRVALR